MIFDRSKLEIQEEQSLAPYGLASKNSKGRLYPEPEPKYRTCFQRDRDRILHTTAFRRLEYKTQVFINFEGDYYRTRLTHTLEVAQIGRSIARALGGNEDLVEAICLAHDLGHPAFGHSGEEILSQLMTDHGGFEHNKHSFRIVSFLENRFPKFPGLNLTWESLEGIVKHETEYDNTDAQDFNPELRGHLEAQITNIADELAYTAHDLDDGLRSGMINPQMLMEIDLWKIITENIGWQSDCQLDDLTRHHLIRQLIGFQVEQIVQNSEKNLEANRVRSVDELQSLSYNVMSFNQEIQEYNRQLKDFLFEHLYKHFRLVRMSMKAERILSGLFQTYLAEPETLPKHVQKWIDERGLERTICDYIAGMTDRYAVVEYQKLFDPTFIP
jgi:dGTPase